MEPTSRRRRVAGPGVAQQPLAGPIVTAHDLVRFHRTSKAANRAELTRPTTCDDARLAISGLSVRTKERVVHARQRHAAIFKPSSNSLRDSTCGRQCGSRD